MLSWLLKENFSYLEFPGKIEYFLSFDSLTNKESSCRLVGEAEQEKHYK
jgi:hypothetical protein